MVTISVCGAAERDRVIDLLDDEFIVSRGRTVSLVERFAAAFGEPGARLIAAHDDGQIAAAALVRPFTWLTGQRPWRGAMIGMVCVRRDHRGTGLGAALMSEATSFVRAQADFGVLWAAQPGFYARLGWRAADCGVLGRMRSEGGSPAMAAGNLEALLPRIHALREAQAGERVQRSLACYRSLPPPAVTREALLEAGSYAVLGRLGDSAYVYEIGGDDSGLAQLEVELRRRYKEVVLNLGGGSAAHRWFGSRPDIAWSEQSFAMWMPVSGALDMDRLGRWYVPFLDRI